MSKKIVVCCDGTWNEPNYREDARTLPSNVLKAMRAIAPEDPDGTSQIVYYQEGLGTANWWDRVAGGVAGIGLARNIQDGYRFIAANYRPGDQLYLFGFSRGAYTVRALAGMIGCLGIVAKTDLDLLPSLYAYYRTQPEQRAASRHHDLLTTLETHAAPISFLGVWDSVGALGIPLPVMQPLSRRLWVGFHNLSLGHHIRHAYQALAIDEHRRPMTPNLWTRVDEHQPLGALIQEPLAQTSPPTVLQVWFAGSHANVGGGYRDPGLSDTTLAWMLHRAGDCGLAVNPAFMEDTSQFAPNEHGNIEDSYALGYRWIRALVPPYQRPIGPSQTDRYKTAAGLNEMIHSSVIDRINGANSQYEPEAVSEALYAKLPIFRERSTLRRDKQHEPAKLNGSAIFTCEIIDISSGGARLESNETAEIGEAISFEASDQVRHQGQVAWHKGNQIGVRFDQQATG